MEEIDQQMSVFFEPELTVIRHLHRLIYEQMPRIGTMPVGRAKETSMGHEQQITRLVPIVQVRGDAMRYLFIRTSSCDDGSNLTFAIWEAFDCAFVGLPA